MSISKARLSILGVLIVAVLALAGSLTVQAQEDVYPETLELGFQIYLENCAVCHGENGQGRVGATLAKDWPSIRPDLAVRQTIVNGVPGSVMPAWAQENGGPLANNE
ncbi:MAG: c-type cytochrome, partial [Anaerolineales bacterium]|nr:c-type cytochrome [Anaerolineales bacterium]